MAAPVTQKTWTISPNNSIAFVSLVITCSTFLKGMADFLLAHGYTCKGSSNGVLAAMDGVNRWVTAANAAVRGTTTLDAQSWMVLTDANGCNILLAFQGGSDDVARFSFSPGGLYVAAGTPTFTPTATDEGVMMSGNSVIGATASESRFWNGWVDSQSKLCRFQINRASSMVGCAWGVELFSLRSTVTQVVTPVVWGFGFLPANFFFTGATGFLANYSGQTRGGLIKTMGATIGIGGAGLTFFGNAAVWGDVQTELQGGVGYPMFGPFSLGCSGASRQGPVGYVFDWWSGRDGGGAASNNGDTMFSKTFVQWGGTNGLVWPWDGSTTPNTGIGGISNNQPGNAIANEPGVEGYGTPTPGINYYVPLANSSVSPIGPTAAKTVARRPGVQVLRLAVVSADLPAEPGRTIVYSRLIAGQYALFSRAPDGTIYQIGAG